MNAFKKSISVLVGLLFSVLMTSSFAAGSEVDKHVEKYVSTSNAILENIASGAVDAKLIEEKSKDLVEQGKWFCELYAKKFPKSKKLMELTLKNAKSMQALSLADIEKDWHENKFFDKPENKLSFDIDDEDYEHYANATDAVIHPATAVVLIKLYQTDHNKAHLDQIKAEISEVVSHIKQVKGDVE